jgi:hypothetical protein
MNVGRSRWLLSSNPNFDVDIALAQCGTAVEPRSVFESIGNRVECLCLVCDAAGVDNPRERNIASKPHVREQPDYGFLSSGLAPARQQLFQLRLTAD